MLYLDYAQSSGPGYRLTAGVHSKLPIRVNSVAINCCRGHREHSTGLIATQALCKQRRHFQLAIRQYLSPPAV